MADKLYEEEAVRYLAKQTRRLTRTTNTYKLSEIDDALSTVEPIIEGETPSYINFLDYTGKIVYAYSKDDISEMASTPTLDDTDDLIFDGWNYTSFELQQCYNPVDVGACYHPKNVTVSDVEYPCDLIVNISLPSNKKSPTVQLYQSVANGAIIFWGDGSTSNVGTSAGRKTLSHTYSLAGDYQIKVLRKSGFVMFGGLNTNSPVSDTEANIRSDNLAFITNEYKDYISKIHVGPNAVLGLRPFAASSSVRYITLPNNMVHTYTLNGTTYEIYSNVSDITARLFSNMSNLRGIIFPRFMGRQSLAYMFTNDIKLEFLSFNPSMAVTGAGNAFIDNYYWAPIKRMPYISGLVHKNHRIETLSYVKNVTDAPDIQSYKLNDLYFEKCTSVVSPASQLYSNYTNIHVPNTLVEAYEASEWKTKYNCNIIGEDVPVYNYIYRFTVERNRLGNTDHLALANINFYDDNFDRVPISAYGATIAVTNSEGNELYLIDDIDTLSWQTTKTGPWEMTISFTTNINMRFASYSITTSNLSSDYDPGAWTLEISTDGGETYELLDQQIDIEETTDRFTVGNLYSLIPTIEEETTDDTNASDESSD